MTKYVSTRGGKEVSFLESAMLGLSPNGGLFLPQNLSEFAGEELDAMCGMPYVETALAVMIKLGIGIPLNVLEPMLKKTYSPEVFCNTMDGDDPKDIVPVRDMGNDMYLIRASNGRSLSFKDIGLQLLGNIFEYLLEKENEVLNILGATSGDTGRAAVHAMMDKKRIRTCILSPRYGMSPVQAGDMRGIKDPSVLNIAVEGSFDDSQKIVKAIFNDLEFKERLHLGAVNSINWARIAAQAVYFVHASLKVVGTSGDMVDVSVQSGNFGNAYACFKARALGAPIRKIFVGTNKNDVLRDFFQRGVYRPRTLTHVTSSPSMDINAASNLERYLYYLVNDDPFRLRALMTTLAETGEIELSGDLYQRMVESDIVSHSVGEAECLATIANVYEESGVIIDPHTAIGWRTGELLRESKVPVLVVETAQPCLFDDTVSQAIGITAPRPPAFERVEEREQHFKVVQKDDVEGVKRILEEFAQ